MTDEYLGITMVLLQLQLALGEYLWEIIHIIIGESSTRTRQTKLFAS